MPDFSVYYDVRAKYINTRMRTLLPSFHHECRELQKVAEDLQKKAEEMLALASYFSNLAERETLKEQRIERKTSSWQEDWDAELKEEGESRPFAIVVPRC